MEDWRGIDINIGILITINTNYATSRLLLTHCQLIVNSLSTHCQLIVNIKILVNSNNVNIHPNQNPFEHMKFLLVFD